MLKKQKGMFSDADWKYSIETPVSSEITIKAEKAGYTNPDGHWNNNDGNLGIAV